MPDKLTIKIAAAFASNPGARYRSDGPKSGEEFRDTMLEPMFLEATRARTRLLVDLDGTEGYATSFLEEAFGGLARKYEVDDVLRTLEFLSDDEPDLIEEVLGYIREARAR